MKIVGLTGSIGMGKSTAAGMLRRLGLPVFDADAEVHRLLAPGGEAVDAVLAVFPEAGGSDGGIDRLRLGKMVFAENSLLRKLEAILHPRVREKRRHFLAAQRRRRQPIVILDIPLLYEIGAEKDCDAVLVVSAPLYTQRKRVLARPGMTREKFNNILAKQVPDQQKRQRTPYVVETGLGKSYSLMLLRRYIRQISKPDHR